MKSKLILAIIAVVSVFIAPLAAAPTLPECPEDRDPGLWSLMDEYLLALYDRDPGSYYQIVGDESRLGELADVSKASQDAWAQTQRSFLIRLVSSDTSGYGDKDRVDAELLSSVIRRGIAESALKTYQTPITSISGPQVWLPQMGSRLPMRTRSHTEMYIERLKRVPIMIGDTMDNMRAGIQAGRVMPRVVMKPTVAQALAQCSERIKSDPASSPFFSPLMSLGEDDPLRTEALEIIEQRVVPVFQELALFLQNEYIPACRESVAASDGVDGPRGYNIALARHTTIPQLDADAIHMLGNREVRRIKAEMIGVIQRSDWFKGITGRVDPTPAWVEDDERLFSEFVNFLRTDPQFYHTEPQALLDEYRSISKAADPELVSLFGRLPRLPYGVRRLPRFQEASAPTAYYYPGDLESAVPGYFMANLSRLDQRPRYEMIALTLHEAVPGHHLQNALVQEIEGQHPLRQAMRFTAFGEGWALYAERLGLEMGAPPYGMYENAYDDFGRLNMEMWRALRLVVDTGIHAKGWSRQDAIDFMIANSALAPHNIESEVDRYIGWPGQATAYKVGQLAIMDMRADAEKQLEDRFDLRAFHDEILKDGSIPIPVLDAKIQRWVDSQLD